MKMDVRIARTLISALAGLGLAACSFNPLIDNNHTTGSGASTAIGGGAGAGSIALLGGSKTLMVFGGIGGAAAGYYVSSLRYQASDIIQAGGNVYMLGDYIGIYLPTDSVFDPNTADFTPQSKSILNSVATVLARRPNNNIMISGNTSAIALPGWELKLSEKRAKKVAASLWKLGIVSFKARSNKTRKLTYVGYGDHFPVASTITNKGIRANSRIQITSYPSKEDLIGRNTNKAVFHNVGSLADSEIVSGNPQERCGGFSQTC